MVQIPLSVFFDLLDFISDPTEYKFLQDDLMNELNEKYDALVRREYFTKYKRSEVGSDEREEYRREYIERTGITKSHRSEKEVYTNGL
jgi:hypothetical protein